MQNTEWDAVAIGAGAAGLSAAQMLGRARRRTLVIDAGSPRNRFADQMHGVLGHDGTPPLEVVARGRAEAEAYGVVFAAASVVDVSETSVADVSTDPDSADGGLTVTLEDARGTREVSTRAVILATGVRDELPAIPGLAEGWGRDVLHCPYCHGWEVRDRRLGVLATSPASLHQIELIRQWSPDVTAFTAAMGELDGDTRERLRARGIRIVPSAITEVVRDGDAMRGARTAEGDLTPLDAIFTAGALRPHDHPVAGLSLERADGPFGSFLAVDAMGRTSHPRIWAAGNVVAPMANVPVSMGAGSMAGAAVNATLVAADADAAVRHRRAHAAEWEARYTESDRTWSGRVNATTASVLADLTPGTALDLGCGEGGDVLWLAEQGWRATGVDLSPTAVGRGRAAAAERGLDADFEAGEIDDLELGMFDLVTLSFVHSWDPRFDRIRLLRAAAAHVAPGGSLLSVTHAAPPPWAADHLDVPHLASPGEERTALDLDPAEWTVDIEEVRPRETTAPDGSPAHLDDGVLLLRRRA